MTAIKILDLYASAAIVLTASCVAWTSNLCACCTACLQKRTKSSAKKASSKKDTKKVIISLGAYILP